VFVGATNDKRFPAVDAKNGKEVWSVQLDAVAQANPMTYRGRDDKQYVAVVADDALRVFALP
jgi:quinoprotein glucose dehydrogenase